MRVVLASRSPSRALILRNAGVAFEVEDAGVDEARVKRDLLENGATAGEVAEHLAEAKAVSVSAKQPDALVIAADQTLELDGALIDKAESLGEARERLRQLSGRRHHLHAAATAAVGGETIWRTLESPSLIMRNLSEAFLDGYLARGGTGLLGSVGCYILEGEGAQLFERIDGDYFAVLGLPLLPVLELLRKKGVLAR